MSREDWDRLSSFYHLFLKHNHLLYQSIAQEIRTAVKGLEILDIGCGDGQALSLYAGSASRVTAIDYSAKRIALAEKRENPCQIRYEVHDAAYLPYSARSFDAAVLCNVLDQVSQPEKVLGECADVLRDDGLLITVTYVGKENGRGGFYRQAAILNASLIYHSWTPETCMEFLEEQGWQVKEHRILGKSAPYLFCICLKKQQKTSAEALISTSAEDFYLPLMGRIYAAKHFRRSMNDPEALNLACMLPQIASAMPQISEYTMVSYAALYQQAGSILDQYLRVLEVPVINVCAGLNTFAITRSQTHIFYELDEPDHLKIRESLLPASWSDRYLPYHLLDPRWIQEVSRSGAKTVFLNAAGAFRNRTESEVLRFLNQVSVIGTILILFDADTSTNGGILVARDDLGSKTMPSFTIDSIEAFAAQIAGNCEVLEQKSLFSGISRYGMKPDTVFRIEVVEHLNLRNIYLLKIRKKAGE